MKKLVKKSIKFTATPEIIESLKSVVNMLLSISTLFKYSEITTTGLYHDSIVDNFHEFSDKYSYYAWQISMILSSYGDMAALQIKADTPSNEKVVDFINHAIQQVKLSISQMQVIRDQLNEVEDFSAVYVLEEIMGNSRMHLSELIKLNDPRSLP